MSCNVVDQLCTAPANLEGVKTPRSKCFCCGMPVCCECSTRRMYLSYGKQRLCNDCQVELDGNDKIVMKRLWNRV